MGAVGIALAGVLAVSCQTRGEPDAKDKTKVEPAVDTSEFVPVSFLTPIRLEKGRYSDLFSPESYGVWVGADVAALRRAKAVEQGEAIDPKLDAAVARITENYLIFECHVASVFSDMSIAYDVVGLRGVSAYLLTPGGGKVTPIQVVVGASAREERQGALRKYARTNLIVFQKRDLCETAPTIADAAPSVRLVLEGYDSTFCFEWCSSRSAPQPWIPNQEEYVKALKTGFKETYQGILKFSHVLD
jgi:hypothetical protein